MRSRYTLAISGITLLVLFVGLLFAQNGNGEAPKLAFGSAQGASQVTASPGDTITLKLYLFIDNESGNRIAHIKLTETEVPDGWGLSFDPPTHTSDYNLSGIVTPIEENIYVEPKPVLPEKPTTNDAGTYYLSSPSGKGYLQAKAVDIIVKVPQDAQLGKTYNLRVGGVAAWYGEVGTVLFNQARDFDYKITVIQKTFSEQPMATNQQQPGNSTGIILAVVGLIVVGAAAYFLFFRKK